MVVVGKVQDVSVKDLSDEDLRLLKYQLVVLNQPFQEVSQRRAERDLEEQVDVELASRTQDKW